MIIKRFQAKTENEAVENAKKELGENVVIMNVRNIKKKGIFAFFKGTMVEVTVALEEENNSVPLKNAENSVTMPAPSLTALEQIAKLQEKNV